MGVDLTRTFADWSGTATDQDVDVVVMTASFTMLGRTGGAIPLTERDRKTIRKNALELLAVDRYPQAHGRRWTARTWMGH